VFGMAGCTLLAVGRVLDQRGVQAPLLRQAPRDFGVALLALQLRGSDSQHMATSALRDAAESLVRTRERARGKLRLAKRHRHKNQHYRNHALNGGS
jgi:hypothetical protein